MGEQTGRLPAVRLGAGGKSLLNEAVRADSPAEGNTTRGADFQPLATISRRNSRNRTAAGCRRPVTGSLVPIPFALSGPESPQGAEVLSSGWQISNKPLAAGPGSNPREMNLLGHISGRRPVRPALCCSGNGSQDTQRRPSPLEASSRNGSELGASAEARIWRRQVQEDTRRDHATGFHGGGPEAPGHAVVVQSLERHETAPASR